MNSSLPAGPNATRSATDKRRAVLVLAAVSGLFAALPELRRALDRPAAPPSLRIHSSPREAPSLRFADGQGAPTSLGAFRGRVVLLTIWATWCPPCREEMPALDRLQATLGGPGFEVVALSIDQGGPPVVQAFFNRTGIKHLRPYLDTSGDALTGLAMGGVPLTLLVDGEGREIARQHGPAAWDHPQVAGVIRGYLTPAAKLPLSQPGVTP